MPSYDDFEVSEVKSDAEFDAIIECEKASYSTPQNPMFDTWWMEHLFQSEPDPHAAAIRELSDRQLSWHKADPGSHWVKVTEKSTGKVVGASQWVVHDHNPFEKPQEPMNAYWWPEGDGRKYASLYLNRMLELRPRIMSRPNTLIEIMFVHPDYRRRGVGSLLMEWGVRMTDELGLPGFVESTADGEGLYKKFGYETVGTLNFDLSIPNPSEEWKQLQEKYPAMPGVQMYRPPGGKYPEGKKSYPWENGA
ncbi:uncharacterized protein K452DRAFT_299766 [Aplosporella prunicola CBS 121167]|uniref:N-acetyltransferase domain-containing protein n=1 Tax=Aplosporella prunicola CBS 121167 TaxID=1176127 RepID=A0A6A6BAP3_9PEZI|nr:uncharacterized protein K452DRAFT_299766 [Aplosporella prunicola CBS 121167]KAF2140423.1 hypothetical protein K452DRAFT_299766 [Aplosporella prunicola CBS 121167]